MKLAETAKGLLEGLRPKQSEHKSTKPSKAPESPDTRSHVAVTPTDPKNRLQSATAARRVAEAQRAVTGKSAAILGKRPRHDMGHPATATATAIAIHEDADENGIEDVSVRDTRRLGKSVRKEMVHTHSEDDEDSVEEGSCYSEEESEDSDDEIDESVAEDMRKLEENFKGITQRYRLINRIGEGDTTLFFPPL